MRLLRLIGNLWCELAHPLPRWPVNGYRECPSCLRKKPVEWHVKSQFTK